MPHETPYIAPLPQELQDRINVGNEKVNVLREEELRLKHSTTEAIKDMARLSIQKEEMEGTIERLTKEFSSITESLTSGKAELEKLLLTVQEAKDAERVALKAAKEAKEATEAEVVKRSAVFESIRSKEEDLAVKEDAHKQNVANFEKRKQQVISLLGTI